MNTTSILIATLLLLLATIASGSQVRGLSEANQDKRLLQKSTQVAANKNAGGGKVKTPTGPTASVPTTKGGGGTPTSPTKSGGGGGGGGMNNGPPSPTVAGQPSPPTSIVQPISASFPTGRK